jgi:PAS domain S-box-containing protein
MAAPESAARKALAVDAVDEIPGDIQDALDDMSIPSYAVDRFGVIRWINPAAEKLVGDVRGRQQSSIVVPEQARAARESFVRKIMGTERSTHTAVVVVGTKGERIQIEVNSVPLKDGGRIVGVFGIIPHVDKAPAPEPHPHLTPRQNEILHLLAKGHSTQQIAGELHISIETTRNHVRRMLRSLGAHSRLEAVAVAHREGILRAG